MDTFEERLRAVQGLITELLAVRETRKGIVGEISRLEGELEKVEGEEHRLTSLLNASDMVALPQGSPVEPSVEEVPLPLLPDTKYCCLPFHRREGKRKGVPKVHHLVGVEGLTLCRHVIREGSSFTEEIPREGALCLTCKAREQGDSFHSDLVESLKRRLEV